MVAPQPSKLVVRVRFPLPAPEKTRLRGVGQPRDDLTRSEAAEALLHSGRVRDGMFWLLPPRLAGGREIGSNPSLSRRFGMRPSLIPFAALALAACVRLPAPMATEAVGCGAPKSAVCAAAV